jgi:hypothetical protein
MLVAVLWLLLATASVAAYVLTQTSIVSGLLIAWLARTLDRVQGVKGRQGGQESRTYIGKTPRGEAGKWRKLA